MLTDSITLRSGSRLYGVPSTRTCTQPGTVVPVRGAVRWTANSKLRVNKVDAILDVGPLGGSLNVAIRKNGTVVASLSIAESTTHGTALLPTPIEAVIGDYFTCDVTRVGSSIPGSNLSVTLHYIEMPEV